MCTNDLCYSNLLVSIGFDHQSQAALVAVLILGWVTAWKYYIIYILLMVPEHLKSKFLLKNFAIRV